MLDAVRPDILKIKTCIWGQIFKGSFLTFMKEHGFGVPTDKTTPTVIYTAVFFTKQCLFVDVVRKYSF